MIYELYQFKSLKKEGLLTPDDFDAIEEDLLYVVHKRVVTGGCGTILVVLSRILNSIEDKNLR